MGVNARDLKNDDTTDAGFDLLMDNVASPVAGDYGMTKLVLGAKGTDGDVVQASNPLPVQLSDGSAAIDPFKAEDAAHTTGDLGLMPLAVRNDTLAALAGTDGDYAPLQVDASGGLYVSNADVTTIAGAVSGSEMQVDVVAALPAGTNAIGKLAANDGVDIGDVDVTSLVPGTGATSLGKAEDAAHTTGDTGVMGLAVRNDTLAALAGTDGDYSPLQVNASGALYVQQGAALDCSGATVTVDLGSNNDIQGDIAHDAADSGNPVKIGASAETAEPTAVAGNDRANAISDIVGKLVVRPHCLPGDTLDGNASATDTSDTAVIAAQGAGTRIYVTSIIVSNESATDTAVLVKSAATTKLRIPAPATSDSGGGAILNLNPPLRLGDNEALNFASAASVTTMYVSAVGYKSTA